MACLNPITNKQGNTFSCGKCEYCHNKYIQQWIFRLEQENKLHGNMSLFITLTYDYDNLPFHKGKMTLRKSDYQKFLKRLRKSMNGRLLKYVICGEYGSKNRRPHYHLILFNVTNDDFNEIQNSWGLGAIHIGNTTANSIAYTFKYSVKADLKTIHPQQVRPFVSMSKGLGEAFAFDIAKKSVTGIDKNGRNFVRYSKVRTPKPHFQSKLNQLTLMPYYILPSTKGGTVRMSVPRFYLKCANYDTTLLKEKYQQLADDKYKDIPPAKLNIILAKEAIQRGRQATEQQANSVLFTISKEKSI